MDILTKSARKLFASLATARGRRENGLFMAQGTKCVVDTLDYFEAMAIIATHEWVTEHTSVIDTHEVTVVKKADIERISTLSTAPEVIAVYRIPDLTEITLEGELTIALDGVQDPGNLGTIIRVADWMGVNQIIASTDTVDVWSPKVIQATMGAVSRINVHYVDLAEALASAKTIDIYGTFLDGEDIYKASLSPSGIVVMGNEGRGIRPAVEACVNRRLFIPPYPLGRHTSESLNVAIATAITLSEFRRRM